jgi:RNA polymerase sigma factor (sigma-70 family)
MKNRHPSALPENPSPLNKLVERFPLASSRAAAAAKLLFGQGRDHLVEEVVNDVMLQLWRRHLDGRLPDNPEGWAYKVAWHRAARVARLEGRYVSGLAEQPDDDEAGNFIPLPPDKFTPAMGAELNERLVAVKKLFDAFDAAATTQLNERDTALFNLVYRKKLSGEEAAEQLDLTPEAFRQQWSRLLTKLLGSVRLQLQDDPACRELLATVLNNEKTFRSTLMQFLRLVLKEGVQELERLVKLTLRN